MASATPEISMISEGSMYWLAGKPRAVLRADQVEFDDHVMLPIALAMVVVLAVAPLNRVASMLTEIVGFIVSWIVVLALAEMTCASDLIPIVRGAGGAALGTPVGKWNLPLMFTGSMRLKALLGFVELPKEIASSIAQSGVSVPSLPG